MSPLRRAAAAVLALAILALAGCAADETARAPVVDRSPAAVGAAKRAASSAGTPARAATHVVQRGETLYGIAVEHGVDHRELAQWNQIEDPTKVRVGQALRLAPPAERGAVRAAPAPQVQVGAAPGSGAVEARPLDSRPVESRALEPRATAGGAQDSRGARTAPKALRLPYSKENLAMLSKPEAGAFSRPAVPARPEAGGAPERDPDAIEFIWPAKGRLVAGFSEPNSRGVDIAGRIGDPVVAAAPGRVMYTGTGIRGYGRLIVIRHDNGFNSVYAHNREILVKEGQNVARGEKIAELGDTESDKPKLHFEIRKSGKPVDPLKYLPARQPS